MAALAADAGSRGMGTPLGIHRPTVFAEGTATTSGVTAAPHDHPTLFCVELRTTRWTELVEWYRSVLGLRVLVRVVDDGYALLEAGATRLAILARSETAPASGRWSLGFEVADLEAVGRRLTATGTAATATAHPEGFRELVVTDPDGNKIRLFTW